MSNNLSKKRESGLSLPGDDFGNKLLEEDDEGDKMRLKNEFAVTTRATQTKNFSLRVNVIFLYIVIPNHVIRKLGFANRIFIC